MDGYFGQGTATPAATPELAVPSSALLPRTRRRWLLPLLLCLLTLTVAATVVSVSRAKAVAAPALRALSDPAPAADGWGPSYVDTRGRPARWDPCAPIHYVVSTAWAPPQGRADVTAALGQITRASGLRFVDDGDTDEVPLRSRSAYQPQRYGKRWAPLLVAWVPPARTDLGLGDGVQGVTVAVALAGRGGGSIVTAQVALDADRRLGSGFGPGATEGEVLLHELAHAVGLGHVLDPTQVMYPQTTNSESRYGAGDRAGLVALGRTAGCLPAPPARLLQTSVFEPRP